MVIMLNKAKKILSVLSLSGFSLFQSAHATPVIDDFAYTSMLSDAKTSLRQLDLPLDIYTKMYRRDYGDLRIFNADGQVVPHQVSRVENKENTHLKSLVFYPLDKEQANDSSHISIEVNQATGKQQINIDQSLDKENASNRKTEYQYIIENSTQNLTIGGELQVSSLCRLKLSWEQSQPSLILALALESSRDLQQWKGIGDELNVSRLHYGQSQLVRDEIEFTCTTEPFLRLTWLNQSVAEDNIHLNDIQGFYTQKSRAEPEWRSLGKPQYGDDGNWYFESDTVATLLKMTFIAPQNGLLYKGDLYSRNDSSQAWRYRSLITQYQLNLGEGKLQSHPFSLATSDKYWKFIPATETQFTKAQLPEIKVNWESNKVLFLAQGIAPFQLAFGNPKVLPVESNTLKELMSTFQGSGITIDTVRLFDAKDMDKVFTIDEKNFNYKKLFFWLILLLGTLLMGFMALRLLQQIDK